ncbi:MAG: hypothetical protein LBF56_03445 [Holosporales bacterium]|jgi:hypothetical protein|nr:hypothetical protein [Holosporales bacterium]
MKVLLGLVNLVALGLGSTHAADSKSELILSDLSRIDGHVVVSGGAMLVIGGRSDVGGAIEVGGVLKMVGDAELNIEGSGSMVLLQDGKILGPQDALASVQ